MITIGYAPNKENPTHINVLSPFDEGFIKAARALGGRFVKFTSGRHGWQFPADIKEDVLRAVVAAYGVEPAYKADERATVRLRFAGGLRGYGAPAVFCGIEIASARGRDTGAVPGEGVSVVGGKIRSGGSARNWETVVEPGSEVVIRGFPTKYLEPEGWPVSVEVLKVDVTSAGEDAEQAAVEAAIRLLEGRGYTVTKEEA